MKHTKLVGLDTGPLLLHDLPVTLTQNEKNRWCACALVLQHKVHMMKQTKLVELDPGPLRLHEFVAQQEDVRK